MAEFEDGSFDVVNCLNLFTAIPADVRRECAKEIFRVLAPGGIVAFNDAVQPHDSASQGPDILRKRFNSDFYASYQTDDLNEILFAAGFKPGPTSPIIAAQSKIMSWVKPNESETAEEVEVLQKKSLELFKSEMTEANKVEEESVEVESEMKMETTEATEAKDQDKSEATETVEPTVVSGDDDAQLGV